MTRKEYICAKCEGTIKRDSEPETCPSCRSEWKGAEFGDPAELVDSDDLDQPDIWSRNTKLLLYACIAVFVVPSVILQGPFYAIGSLLGTTMMIYGARYLYVGQQITKQRRELAREKALDNSK